MLSHATPSCGHLWIMTHECAPSRILRAPHLTPLLQICASPRLLARPLSRRATGSHPSKSHSSHRIHRASGFLQTALSKLPREKSRANRASWSGAALIGSYRFWGFILWSSLWGEFIGIPKEVIGMATTCEDK